MIITGKGMLPWCHLFIALLLSHPPPPLRFLSLISSLFPLPIAVYINVSCSLCPLLSFIPSLAPYILYSSHTSSHLFNSFIFSLPQRFWTRWCTVRLCVWTQSRAGGTTMMSTVCTATLWCWLLTSECIHHQCSKQFGQSVLWRPTCCLQSSGKLKMN